MASIVGLLSDAGLEPFQGRFPQLRLVPERPAAVGDRLILTAPVAAVINDATGAFAFAEITASDETIPAVLYTLKADWDVGRERDVVSGLFIPSGNWNFSDLLIASGKANPGTIMYGYGPPPGTLTGVFYIDISGPKPVLYGPSNGGI